MNIIRKNTLRYFAPMIICLSLLSTAASCPPKPSDPQRQDQLVVMAKAADLTVQIVSVVEAAQQTEIALYNAKVVPDLTKEKHDEYQALFLKFAEMAKPQVELAKAASSSDLIRTEALDKVEAGAQELIKTFKGASSPLLSSLFNTLELVLQLKGV